MPPSARLVRTRLTSGTGAALSVLLVAGCSSSHAHTASSTVAGTTPNSATTTPTTTPTTSSTSSGSATVAAALQRLVLRTGDLPAGWTGAAYQSSPGASNAHAAFSQCAGIPNSDSAKTGEVHSDDFSQGEATISSEAFGYSSAAAVTSDRSAIAGPKAKQCFQTLFDQQLRAALPAGSTLKPPSVTVTPGAVAGMSNVVGTVSASVSVSASGQSITVYVGAVFIAGPTIEAEVTYENVGAPFDTGVLDTAVRAVSQRVAGA